MAFLAQLVIASNVICILNSVPFEFSSSPGWLSLRSQLVICLSDTKSVAGLVLGILFVKMSLSAFHNPFAESYTTSLSSKPNTCQF
jgi:hypothetical protein